MYSTLNKQIQGACEQAERKVWPSTQKPDLDNTNAGTLYEDYGKRPNRCFPYFIVALICGAIYILWKTANALLRGDGQEVVI